MIKNLKKELKDYNLVDISEVSGGDVNRAFKLKTNNEDLFLLFQENRDKSFYDAEVKGLKDFEKNGINAPKVKRYGQIKEGAYLLLNYVKMTNIGDQKKLAELIVRLHKIENENDLFGYDYPYHGSAISFDNSYSKSWIKIFVENRMDKLKDALVYNKLWDENNLESYKKARLIMVDELEKKDSKPRLLHGDLWAGNFSFDENSNPIIYDPASFYGDREFDIAVTTVFGGFNQDFYKRYFEKFPLDEDYKLRLEFYRLYLFMVHLLKFGKIYESSVTSSMNKILKNI